MRASDHDRDRVVHQLRHHTISGRISSEELERRLELALSAETTDQLAAVAGDLPTSPAGDQAIAAGASTRLGPPGIRPFLVEIVASGDPQHVRATALRTLGRGLVGSGFELVSESPAALEFARASKASGLRGWFVKERERVVISFASHRPHETAMLVYGRASRKVRKGFAQLAQGSASPRKHL